jgi:hypothetical protein
VAALGYEYGVFGEGISGCSNAMLRSSSNKGPMTEDRDNVCQDGD